MENVEQLIKDALSDGESVTWAGLLHKMPPIYSMMSQENFDAFKTLCELVDRGDILTVEGNPEEMKLKE
jgi:hypothetical protein